MSDLSVKTVLEAGRQSLKEKNYWSALIVALTLPSICSRIAYSSEKYKNKTTKEREELIKQIKEKSEIKRTTKSIEDEVEDNELWHFNKDGTRGWADGKAYSKWCRENMVVNFGAKDKYFVLALGDKYDKVLYNMRCSILHEFGAIKHGTNTNTDNIYEYDDEEKPMFFSIGFSSAPFSDKYLLSIEDFCSEIFDFVDNWVRSNHWNIPNRTYFDKNSPADRSKYEEMFNNEKNNSNKNKES